MTRQAIEFDARRALRLIAVISLSLALINLFPFLPLDGGHIFWSLVEKVRGQPVPFSVMERASVVGFVLVLIIFVIGFSNDIDRLTGEGFDVDTAAAIGSGTAGGGEMEITTAERYASGGPGKDLLAQNLALRSRRPSIGSATTSRSATPSATSS